MLNFMFLGTNGSMQGDEGNTSLLFKGSRGTVLVDASCGLGRAVAADVDAVILTHEHIDHVYGLPSLIHQLWLSGRRRALDICVPAGMEEFVHRFLEVFSLQEKKNMFDFRIRTGRQFSVGSMEITLFLRSTRKPLWGWLSGRGRIGWFTPRIPARSEKSFPVWREPRC